MENKYFTPDIEDLCIGYECEICWDINEEYPYWIPKILDRWEINAVLDGKEGAFRTPYLTKEQIEAEGWSEVHEEFFKKKNFSSSINFDINTIVIRENGWFPENTLYKGNCKDINTFRKIIKLLGI